MTSASAISTAKLYGSIGQLAYTESKMADTPLIPFDVGDVDTLTLQSTKLADLAIALHDRDPSDLEQDAVNSAIDHTQIAQSMFDAINKNPTNNLARQTVYDSVQSAIDSLRTVMS